LNDVHLRGTVDQVQQRWTPDGGMAVNALLMVPRTAVASERQVGECEQPLPLRAHGKHARLLLENTGNRVEITGQVRRRLYQRQQKIHWGQVEIWVTDCLPI